MRLNLSCNVIKYVKNCYDEALQANKDIGEIEHRFCRIKYIFIKVTSL